MSESKGLLERLTAGEDVMVAEGYMFEFKKQGYLQFGGMVPEVVIERPHLVESVHEEYVHAGSDVVLAFTYYGHRHKMGVVGREDEVEKLNRNALRLARKVADNTGTLMAGNLCNTTIYDPSSPDTLEMSKSMFTEQVKWATEEKADFIVGETFYLFSEAMMALEVIKEHGNGLPAVITLGATAKPYTVDGVPLAEACKKLEEAGAAVVGLNCHRGPRTMVPLLKDIRQACKGPIAALPVTYKTTTECPVFQAFKDPDSGKLAFPTNLAQFQGSIDDIEFFGRSCKEIGVQYIGLCCGNTSDYFRHLVETCGRTPPASRYASDMSKHFIFHDLPLDGIYKKLKSDLLSL